MFFFFQLDQLLRENAAVAAALVVFAVDDPGSLHEAEKIIKQLSALHFLDKQVVLVKFFKLNWFNYPPSKKGWAKDLNFDTFFLMISYQGEQLSIK